MKTRKIFTIVFMAVLPNCGQVTNNNNQGPDSAVLDIDVSDRGMVDKKIYDKMLPDKLMLDQRKSDLTIIDIRLQDKQLLDKAVSDIDYVDNAIKDMQVLDTAHQDMAAPDMERLDTSSPDIASIDMVTQTADIKLIDKSIFDKLFLDKQLKDKAISDQQVIDKNIGDGNSAACTHPVVAKNCTKNGNGIDWCTVPAGCFKMGSPATELCRQTDEIQHQVTLTHKFEIQSTMVTQGQFLTLMGYNPSYFSKCGSSCPVEFVNWHESVAYCNALSAKSGLTSCYTCTGSGKSTNCQDATSYTGGKIYDCKGYRLPTEAEREYAYRAGTNTAFYNGGIANCSGADTNADKIAWYLKNSDVTYSGCHNTGTRCLGTHPVGKKTPNAWGLYDMAGNNPDWCHDWYQSSYGSGSQIDPWGPNNGSKRVQRGGSWCTEPTWARAAFRGSYPPAYRDSYFGFRCVRTL